MRKELSLIVQNELKDPGVGFIAITRVEVSPDLRYAKAYFSCLGNSKEKQKSMDALTKASGFIRRLLSKNMQLRYTPEISFKLDESSEYSIHITELLDGAKKDSKG